MDSANIMTAAIYGGIGGGLGALLGVLIGSLFRNTKFHRAAAAALAGGGAVLGMNVAEPLLEPYIGEYLPKSSSEKDFDEQFEAMIEELKTIPTAAAALERDPSLKDELRSNFKEVIAEAKTPAIARQMGFSSGYNTLVGKLVYFLARATDEDLIIFINTNVETLTSLSVRDPRFCYDYLYNPAALAAMSPEQIQQKIGPEWFDRQQEEVAILIRNSADNIPAYDVAAAEAALQEAAGVFQQKLGDKIGLVAGTMFPETDADAKLACDATSVLYAEIAGRENPVLAGRHIFAKVAG